MCALDSATDCFLHHDLRVDCLFNQHLTSTSLASTEDFCHSQAWFWLETIRENYFIVTITWVGLFKLQPDFRIQTSFSKRREKKVLRCILSMIFPPFRIQTLTLSHPCNCMQLANSVSAEFSWLCAIIIRWSHNIIQCDVDIFNLQLFCIGSIYLCIYCNRASWLCTFLCRLWKSQDTVWVNCHLERKKRTDVVKIKHNWQHIGLLLRLVW